MTDRSVIAKSLLLWNVVVKSIERKYFYAETL